jgi:hypothetical protein
MTCTVEQMVTTHYRQTLLLHIGLVVITVFYSEVNFVCFLTKKKQTPWPEPAGGLLVYRPSDCRLSAKLVPTVTVRGLSRS